nr:transposase [Brucella anthropi]
MQSAWARYRSIISLADIATIDIPKRFRSSRAVGAMIGLTPLLNQLGENKRIGHVTLCGDSMLRSLLYEAAQVLLTPVTNGHG